MREHGDRLVAHRAHALDHRVVVAGGVPEREFEIVDHRQPLRATRARSAARSAASSRAYRLRTLSRSARARRNRSSRSSTAGSTCSSASGAGDVHRSRAVAAVRSDGLVAGAHGYLTVG